MTTLAIELPEDVAERIQRIPEAERNNFAIAALRKELSPSLPPERTADAILTYLKPVLTATPPPSGKKAWSEVEGYE